MADPTRTDHISRVTRQEEPKVEAPSDAPRVDPALVDYLEGLGYGVFHITAPSERVGGLDDALTVSHYASEIAGQVRLLQFLRQLSQVTR